MWHLHIINFFVPRNTVRPNVQPFFWPLLCFLENCFLFRGHLRGPMWFRVRDMVHGKLFSLPFLMQFIHRKVLYGLIFSKETYSSPFWKTCWRHTMTWTFELCVLVWTIVASLKQKIHRSRPKPRWSFYQSLISLSNLNLNLSYYIYDMKNSMEYFFSPIICSRYEDFKFILFNIFCHCRNPVCHINVFCTVLNTHIPPH